MHTSGFTYGFFKPFPGGGPVEQMYLDGGVNDLDITNAELVTRISKLPLKYEPGTTWWYSRSTDVLGRLIEVVSGMTLGEFFEKRISQTARHDRHRLSGRARQGCRASSNRSTRTRRA